MAPKWRWGTTGYKIRPTLFYRVINELKTVSQRSSNWIYVDDITLSEIVPVQETSINLTKRVGPNWCLG